MIAKREYPNDAMTRRVARALQSGRKLRRDGNGWLVDAKTGKLIGPDPAIEQPLTKAQVVEAVVRRGRPLKPDRKQSTTLRLDPEVIEHFRATGPGWQTRISEVLLHVVRRAEKRLQGTMKIRKPGVKARRGHTDRRTDMDTGAPRRAVKRSA